jgi:hypothetical protein
MSRPSPPPRSSLVPTLAVGAVAALLGVLAGMGLGGGQGPGPTTGALDPQVRGLLEDLTRDVAALRLSVQDLNLPPAFVERTPLTPDDEVEAGRPVLDSSEIADLLQARPAPMDLREIEQRLSSIETLQAQLIILQQTNNRAMPMLGVPAGMDVRDYMRVLKEGDDGGSVQQAHMLWDANKVRNEYGPPDEIEDHGDYIEWIYWISEDGDQFDFHFVNDLCVQAH